MGRQCDIIFRLKLVVKTGRKKTLEKLLSKNETVIYFYKAFNRLMYFWKFRVCDFMFTYLHNKVLIKKN